MMIDAYREAARLTEEAAQLTDRAVTALTEKLNATAKSAKVSYANGDQYEGQTRDASQTVRHGYGVYQYHGGLARYEGEFVDDDKHGSGTLFFDGGDVYEGQWCKDRQHGQGALVHWSPQAGVWVYHGEFRDGERNGYGSLHARDIGGLVGLWESGGVVTGSEISIAADGDLRAAAVCEGQGEVHGNITDGLSTESQPDCHLGGTPQTWSAHEVSRWLKALGVNLDDDKSGSPLAAMTGAQLLALSDFESLAEQCQASIAWRTSVKDALAILRRAAVDADRPLRSWQELQTALPSVGKRTIPFAELSASAEAAQNMSAQKAEWRGMALELLPLPLRLPMEARPQRRAAEGVPSEAARETGDESPAEAGEGSFLPLAAARAFVRDLEVLAAGRHPNLRSLVGVTLCSIAETDPTGTVVPLLVYEGPRGARLLFEWVHAMLPDGSRQPMDFRLEMRVCIGILEALAWLSSKGLVCAAVCSVNVELMPTSSKELIVRLTHAGGSWWRWGWRRSLQVRDAGQPRRRALGMEEVVRRYAICPVNWLAPEVLRGQPPEEPADVYGLGMVLWEMLYRTVPFGDFSIAQIIGSVGYGRRSVPCVASQGASTETTFLHEVVSACTRREPKRRPAVTNLLVSLQEGLRTYEKRRSQRSALEKLGDKTEAFASGLLSGKLHKNFLVGSSSRAVPPQHSDDDGGPRMVRLDSGEWVQVDVDLVEQYPGDEEKWRALMSFRAHLLSG